MASHEVPGQPQAGSSSANPNGLTSVDGVPATRRADELARKDRTLAEFMLMLDDYEPLVSATGQSEPCGLLIVATTTLLLWYF